MRKKQNLLVKTILSVAVFILSFSLTAQSKFSENQLIGKSKIKLYGTNYKLQKEAYLALNKMIMEAKKQGVLIHVTSTFRGFNHQNRLWKSKYDKFVKKGYSSKGAVNKVKEYTAIPGTSRHHWGTDVDLSNKSTIGLTNNDKRYYSKWMNENAHKFGFYRVYTNNKFREGYNYESWHYTYRKVSKPMLEQYNQLDLERILKNQDIAGNENFTSSFIKQYKEKNVLGINHYLY